MEVLDDIRELQNGVTPAAVLGEGTLLDDFVLSASHPSPECREADQCASRHEAEATGVPEDARQWDFESVVSSDIETESDDSGELRCVSMFCERLCGLQAWDAHVVS
jgi:hypothetical protein